MASKEARQVVCYCLEYPEKLKDKEVAALYEFAKKELDDHKIKRSGLTWYRQKELYFEDRPELLREVKRLIKAGETNTKISKRLHIDVKAVAYVQRKYKLFKPVDITKEELEKLYANKRFCDICEELCISESKLIGLLRKYKIKSKHPVKHYRVRAIHENGEEEIYDSVAEIAKIVGRSVPGMRYRLNTGKYYDGVKFEKVYY